MMRWTRVENGVYTSGPYVLERNAPPNRGTWSVSGPGVSAGIGHERKDDAQSAASRAMAHRLADGGGATVTPARGDRARLRDTGRAGVITSVFPGDNGHPLYCIRLPRNRRVCVHREEFEVIEP